MGLDIGFAHEGRSVATCRSSGERERPRCYGTPAFHREPIYNAAYGASWWPEAGRATLPVQALSMQGRPGPSAGFTSMVMVLLLRPPPHRAIY